MIARLRGELLEIAPPHLVVDVQGVGYEVMVPEHVLAMNPTLGMPVDLTIRQVFREDGVTLYGFSDSTERQVFDLMTGVNGCGPKTGLSLLSMVGTDAALSAIVTGDAKVLTRASGVGAKLAERLILELKDKVQELMIRRKVGYSGSSAVTKVAPVVSDELIEALMNLGCRRNEADNVAAQAREQSDDLQEQIVIALRLLKK